MPCLPAGAKIGWSYDLLGPLQQTLFTQLVVFAGGCTLQAAELLCGDRLTPALPLPLSPTQVLDGLALLLDRNLLQRETGVYGEPRYHMLETVREYGLKRLALSGQDAILAARHARSFLHLIEHIEQADLDPSHLLLNHLIDDDIHNVRAALAWATKHDVQAALLLTAALVTWLFGRGPYAEGRLLIAGALALPGAAAPTIPRARLLHRAARLMLAGHDLDQTTSDV